jgi:fucose 4-O-acetylase-like acetyltransferase
MKPAGDLTAFTLFPWAGFVFAGAACGVMLATTENTREERRVQFAFAMAGLVLIALGHFLSRRPSIYDQSEFWTSSPTWFAIRIGILMTAVAVIDALSEIASHWNLAWRSLERFGRSSLFVYWIHVELVYGYATWPLHHRLPLWGTLVACAAFTVLMYRAVILRDLIVDNWRTRSRSRRTPQTATA